MFVIIGATGNIGRHLVPLIPNGEPVRIVSRSEENAQPLLGDGVTLHRGDLLDPATAEAALQGARRVFLVSAGGPDQEALERNVIKAAAAARVKHLVKVSVIDPSPDHVVHLARTHHRIEEELVASGVPHTILRPNWFMENFLGSADTIAQGALYGSAGDGRVGFVAARDIAAVAAVLLRQSSGLPPELVVTGPRAITFAEAAAAIGRGLSRDVRYVDLDDTAFAGALADAGLPAPVVEVVTQINQNARRGGLAQATDTVARLTGRDPVTLEAFAKEHASSLVP